MKARSAAVPFFALAISLAAIYVALRRPHFAVAAAAIVLVAGLLAVMQAWLAARAAALAHPRLLNLASSSRQWKEAVRVIVARVAAAEGYLVHKILADAANFDDPTGGRVYVFMGQREDSLIPNGLLVLSPEDFARLSLLDARKIEREIYRALFGRWGRASLAKRRGEIAAHIADTAARLYSLQFFGVGFKVALGPDVSGGLQARIGPLDLEFNREELEDLLELPCVQMNLRILEALGRVDPSAEHFVWRTAHGKAAD